MIVPPDVIDEIRGRVDLVELIGRYVPLKRAGERWKGLCPFHQEKTPSFTVNPKLGIFHCFGCHAGGDAFEFLKRHDRLEFPEAVRALADLTGVPLPTRPGARAEAGVREALYRVAEWAARQYETWLWQRADAERARSYLAERLERVFEFDAVALDDEVDRVAAFLAPVAVEELPGRADGERRGLLLVERAQALVVAPGALQGDGLPDELDEVCGGHHAGLEIVPSRVAAAARPAANI